VHVVKHHKGQMNKEKFDQEAALNINQHAYQTQVLWLQVPRQ